MEFKRIKAHKETFIPLLLLADDLVHIRSYLEEGTLFVLSEDSEVKAVCIVNSNLEIENLAVAEQAQGQGYGKQLLTCLFDYYRGQGIMTVGTDEVSGNIQFYQSCGFEFSHKIKDYLIEYYESPLYEKGKLLKDKSYLRKEL